MQALSTLIIDRFEGDFAICEREDCTMVTIEISRLPIGVLPGNILKIEKDGTIRLDAEEELRRREMIFRMQESLFENSDEESI